MRDIVSTIQADQYRLITRDLEGLLLIQGGPGTGKTAVALHRASWLLYTFRDRLAEEGVLVVGPNPTFMEYVSHVLPALGEESVEQAPVGELVNGVRAVRSDPPEVERLKGDARMAEVIERAVAQRIRSLDEHLWVRAGGVGLTLSPETVAEFAAEAREQSASYAAGRERFRMQLLRRFYEAYGRKLGPGATLSFDEVERALGHGGFLRRVLDRVWPVLDPEEVVRRLLTTRTVLAAAADGLFDREERALLARGRGDRGWSEADVPLVDEARALVQGSSPAHGHVLVDEAQDLTPMQLRMVARRARRGSLTVLGDIAQGTGPAPYESWDEVLEHLPDRAGVAIEELRLAYRVPREIMDFALPLLPLVAPAVEPPVSYRAGGGEPRVVEVGAGELARSTAELAAVLREGEGTVGVIVPAELLEETRAGLASLGLRWADSVAEELAPSVQLLVPREAKGLEFDHVIVAEPAAIVTERGGVAGLRELYVSLTRPTTTLVVVHARPLPRELDRPVETA
jgi:DNA helicase IV